MNFGESSKLIFAIESWNDAYKLDKSKIHVYIESFQSNNIAQKEVLKRYEVRPCKE